MASVAQFNQDNPDQEGQNPGGGGQVLNSTGGGGESSGGSTPPGQGAYSAPRQAQNSTPNINQYLQANQGAGQQLAGGITNNIQNQANQLGQNVNTAQNSLENKYQPLQQNLGDQAQKTIQTAFQNPQQLLDSYNQSKTQSSSQPLTSDQQNQANQYNQFQQLNSGGYNQDINAYGQAGSQFSNNLQNQYQNLAQQTGAAANEMGRNQLLQNTIGRPEYNQGQQTLDTLFLQAQPGVANQLKQNLGQIGSQAQQQVQGFTGDTQSKLAALQGLASQDQQGIKNLFTNGSDQGTGLNQIGQNVQNEYNTLKDTSAAANTALQDSLKTGKFSPEQLQQMGLQNGMQTWGASLSPFYSQNALSAANQGGNAQAASPEEFARYNALNQLAGGPNGLQTSIFGGASTAGGYSPYSFNAQGFQQAVADKQNTINNVDFRNAIAGTLHNFNMSPNSQQVPNGGVAVPIAQQLQAGLQAGTLTPEQANQIIQSGTTALQNKYGANPGYAQAFSPFNKYFSGEYQPAASSIIGNSVANPNPGSGQQGAL